MKLSDAQIERTLHQYKAEAIPAEYPVVSKLESLFGDRTYFLDDNGLYIVEPVDGVQTDGHLAVVVNLANWADADAMSLQTHDPERTDLLVDLQGGVRH